MARWKRFPGPNPVVPPPKKSTFGPSKISIVRSQQVVPHPKTDFWDLKNWHREVSKSGPPTHPPPKQSICGTSKVGIVRSRKVVPHPKNRFVGLQKLASYGLETWSPTLKHDFWDFKIWHRRVSKSGPLLKKRFLGLTQIAS